MHRLKETTTLPEKPNFKSLNDFVIEVKQVGNDAIPEQSITVGTTVNVKYMQ